MDWFSPMPTPGGKCAAAAALRKFIGQALQSPTLREETTENPDERIRFAGSISFSASCTEYRVEKSHNLIVPLIVIVCSCCRKTYARNVRGGSDISVGKPPLV